MTVGTRKKIINMMPTQKRHNFTGKFSSILFLCLLFLFPTICSADSAQYFYDNAVRLVRVAKGTEGLVYQYDSVGNLLSISKGTVGTGAPVINSLNPDVLFIGSTTTMTIKGQNFFTTKEVKTDPVNSSVTIKILNVTDTEIKTDITVSSGALPEAVNIKVTTNYGSASKQASLTLSELAFYPGYISLAPNSTGNISAVIYPSLGKDVTITLNNNNPSIASVPQLVNIPSSGSANFSVNAIKKGMAIIDSGVPRAVVYVADAFTPEPGEEITTKTSPVSVYIEAPSSVNTSTSSLPVSVYIETPSSMTTTTSSLPVSVKINESISVETTTSSLPVSVYIETPSSMTTTTSSLPVSVYIETPSSMTTTTSSLPVSVYIETPSSMTTTTSSLPVSVYIETPSSMTTTIVSPPVSTKISQP